MSAYSCPPPFPPHSPAWSDAESDTDNDFTSDPCPCSLCSKGIPSGSSSSPLSHHSNHRTLCRPSPSPHSVDTYRTEFCELSVEDRHGVALVRRFLEYSDSVAEQLEIRRIQEEDVSRPNSTFLIASALFRRDRDFVKEMLARMEFEEDLSRVHASRRRLSAAILSSNMSQQAATNIMKSSDDTDFESVAGCHLRAFTASRLFQSARPHLERYYHSQATRCVGVGLPRTRYPLAV
jgi:hypothetical protein